MEEIKQEIKDAVELVAQNEEFSLHAHCVFAFNKMQKEGIQKHISYLSDEDLVDVEIPKNGRIPKITIEWVDEMEARDANNTMD